MTGFNVCIFVDDIFNLYFVKWLSGWQVTLRLGQLFAGNFRIELFGAMTMLGPDTRVVLKSMTAENVWNNLYSQHVSQILVDQKIERLKDYSCVLADTWVLLLLEGLSAGKIIAEDFRLIISLGRKRGWNYLIDLLLIRNRRI